MLEEQQSTIEKALNRRNEKQQLRSHYGRGSRVEILACE